MLEQINLYWRKRRLTAGAVLVVREMGKREDGHQVTAGRRRPVTRRALLPGVLVSPDHTPLAQHQLFELLVLQGVDFAGQSGRSQHDSVTTVSG